ncbi:MAG: hypothetical protein AAGA75_20920 [Cyanobacteria bacterium P01_E01_bin.6]
MNCADDALIGGEDDDAKYLDIIKTKTPNPVPPAARAAQDL